jgi:hypothetical protein
MEQQQQTKGIGKESQLSKIAAAVNPGSMAEANPTATQSMISTFMQTFESSALEMREETNDDQKELIKTMIDEITKLQTKNMKEFEKAIGKIVGITKDLQNSDNPLLQKLGKEMEEKSREEVVKASGYTLTGEKDTFLNRLGRSVGMNTEEEPVEKNRQGIGKLAKGFASNVGGTLKRGFNIAVGREAPEGSFADNVFTSDEQKRERLLSRVDSESNETQSVSANETIKKVIEEYFKEDKQKSESSEKNSKETLTVSSLTEAFKTALNQHFNESKTSSTSSDKNPIESSSDSSNSSEKNNIESSSDSSMTKSLEEFSQESRKESNSSSEENSLISTLTDEQKNLYSQFEKLMEEFNNQEKTTEELENIVKEINVLNEKFVAAYPSTKSPSVNSEAQEDAAGISKDATIEALQKTADSNVLVQENTSETVDVLKQILEQMKNMPVGGGGGGGDSGGGGMVPGLLGAGLGAGLASGAKAIGRGVKAVGRGIASGARVVGRGIASGARVVGSAVGSGARMLARGIGSGARALATGARAITAPMAVAGTAAVAATGSILYGVDKFIKNTNIGARKEQEEGTAKFGLTGNNMDGFFINGKPAGKYKDLPEYYQKVSDGYGANSRGGAAERAREYVKTHNPDGSPKTEKDKKKSTAEPVAKPKPTVATTVKKASTKSDKPKAKAEASDKPKAKAEASDKPKAKAEATVEKSKETAKPKAVETVKEATEPKKKQDQAPSLDAVDKSIKGKVAEIDPKGKWAKLKDGKIVDPDFPNDANSNNTAAAAYKLSSKTGKVEGKGNQTGDQISPKKATGKTETGKNIDGTLIEQGTAETKDKVQVNVPPPTVINQGGGGGQAPPQITFPGGVGSVRTNDSSWQRFQDRRAVG